MHDPINLDPINRRTRWKLRDDAKPRPQPWRWPLPRIDGCDPHIVGTYASDERRGVDLGYGNVRVDRHERIPVFAVQDGAVSAAYELASGYFLWIEHGERESATTYSNLSEMTISPCRPRTHYRRRVRAGEIIGFANRSPAHIRFELWDWTFSRGFVAIDPIETMKQWVIEQSTPKPIGFAPKEAA